MSIIKPSSALQWRKAFASQYKVLYSNVSNVKKHLIRSLQEVIKLLNIQVNIKSLNAWTRSRSISVRQSKEKIKEACNTIIHK